MLKVCNRNTRKRCETCSKLTINTPCSSVSVVDSELVNVWLDLAADSRAEEPAGNKKVNNRNTRTRCEICSKLTIKKPERRHWRRSDVFIVNFKHISQFVLVFLLLTLNM